MDRFVSSGYIEEIARLGSISAAADKFEMSQPALSMRLRKTEDRLGIEIFDRTKQPLELTEAGRLYLDYAERRDHLDREFMQRISDMNDLKAGTLVIGGAGSLNVSYLPRAVSVFSKKYPGIDIEIVNGRIPEIAEMALAGKVDLFIAHPMERDEMFRYEKLFDERIFVCVPADWDINAALRRDDRKRCVDMSALSGMPFIMLGADQHLGIVMRELIERHGVRPGKVIRVDQTVTSFALTLAGVGISLMTESCLADAGPGIRPELYIADTDICRRDMYAVYPGGRYLSKASSEFIKILKTTLTEHLCEEI